MQDSGLRKLGLLLGVVALVAFAGGCKKQVASHPPTQAAPESAPQPTVTLNASPTSVKSGDTVTLSWTSTSATDLDIEPGVGKVVAQGTTPVNPTQSTTFTNHCHGTGRHRHSGCTRHGRGGSRRNSAHGKSEFERTVRAERKGRIF